MNAYVLPARLYDYFCIVHTSCEKIEYNNFITIDKTIYYNIKTRKIEQVWPVSVKVLIKFKWPISPALLLLIHWYLMGSYNPFSSLGATNTQTYTDCQNYYSRLPVFDVVASKYRENKKYYFSLIRRLHRKKVNLSLLFIKWMRLPKLKTSGPYFLWFKDRDGLKWV